MRFERTIAIVVLGTGMMMGGLLLADVPVSPEPPPETPTVPANPAQQAPEVHPKSKGGAVSLARVPWTKAELKPEHAILAKLVGHWLSTVNAVEGPYKRVKDRETLGTADGKTLMDGLFIQVTHVQKRQRQPFEGLMIYGFDQAIGKYTADWIDSSSTAIIHYIGTYDAEKKQLNMTAHYSNQKSRQLTISRTVTTFVDEKTWTYEEYVSHAVGEKEAPVVGITFKRG